MHTFRIVRSALMFCLLSVSVWAQQTSSTSSPPATSDPQAGALVQRALVALTGGATVSDVTLTGTARRIAGSDDETGTATLSATAAGDSKVSLNFPSGPRTEIRNHSAVPLPAVIPANAPSSAKGPQPAGAWSGPDGVLHPVTPNNIFTDAAWFFPVFTLGRIATSPNYTLSYIGQDSVNGLSALHISAVRQFPGLASADAGIGNLIQHFSQIDIYVDPTSFVPIAFTFNTHPDNIATVDIPTLIEFSNYQSSGGVELPMHVQKYINNGLALDLQFNNVILNSGVTTALFQLQ